MKARALPDPHERAMSKSTIPAGLDRGEIARLREDFRYYDRNKDGLMEYHEFVGFLRALDAGMSEADTRVGFAEVDTDKDGVIEFEEFIEWWGKP